MKSIRPRSAFTLVELLVVLGIIALMAGLMGLALRDGSPARALESAQATVASLLTAARGQAALNQSRAMLLVDADPDNERFLRAVHVAVESAPNSGFWWITERGGLLPRGICMVPGNANPPGVTFAPLAGVWPATRRSSLTVMPAGSISSDAVNASGNYLGMTQPLTATGLAGNGGGDKLVLAIVRRTSAGVIFENSEQVRGVALSSYGVAILINDAPGFDF